MRKFILSFLLSTILLPSCLKASELILTEEDTLKYNFNKYRNQEQPLVLQGGLEGPSAIVGGLGMVVRDFSTQMRERLNNCFTVIPCYNFFRNNPNPNKKIVSLGFFKHLLFNELKTTEVFLNSSDMQILFSPDQSMVDGLKVVTDPNKIYESTQSYLRLTYFNSAIARFSDLMNADIIQLHAWQTALAGALIKKTYNPLRDQKLLKHIKVIATLHMFNEEQGVDSGIIYENVGLQTPLNNTVNLAATAILESDYLTTVSQGLKTYFNNPTTAYGLDGLFKDKENYMCGITNGINLIALILS